MLERDIQRGLVKRLEAEGYIVVKMTLTNKGGFPDLMLLRDGVASFIEVKRPGQKPRPLQRHRIEQLRRAGFKVEVVSGEKPHHDGQDNEHY